MKYLLFALAAALATAASPTETPAPKDPPKRLVILYTAGAKGEIRSCNCTKFRFGGYGRELTLLKSIRAESPDVILVEGGDLCGGTGFQAELKADVAAKALKLLDYAAIVPGEEELGVRGDRHIQRFEGDSAPILCANLFPQDQTEPKYRSFLIVETKNGLKVALIGLLDGSMSSMLLNKAFKETIKDPAAVLPSVLKQVRPQRDIVAIIYHGTPQQAEALSGIEGVDLVLSTERKDNLVPFPPDTTDNNRIDAAVQTKGGAVTAEAGTRTGWSLGRIDLELDANSKVLSARHSLIYLDRRYDEDEAMVRIYEDYNQKVKEAVLSRSAKIRKSAEALLVSRGFNVDEMRERLHKSPFATAEKCKECHSEAYDAWSDSRHARAMATLEKSHQEFDPECVTCHVTGAMVRNGYRDQSDTPELANVQCEACHGPGLEHAASPSKGFGATAAQVCRSCHTEDRNPDFDFTAFVARIKH